jgi:hypothetical protein
MDAKNGKPPVVHWPPVNPLSKPAVMQPKTVAAPPVRQPPPPPPVHWPQIAPTTMQARMQVQAQPNPGVVQLNKDREKRWPKAEKNWTKFRKYNSDAANDIERGLINNKGIPVNKVYAKIINLMLDWKFDQLTIGHASKNKSSKKNKNTDPACETIRTRFQNYLA